MLRQGQLTQLQLAAVGLVVQVVALVVNQALMVPILYLALLLQRVVEAVLVMLAQVEIMVAPVEVVFLRLVAQEILRLPHHRRGTMAVQEVQTHPVMALVVVVEHLL